MQPNNSYGSGFPAGQPPQSQQPYVAQKPKGSFDVWIAVSILTLLLAVILGALFFWAFSERQSYKNDADAKIAAAVEVAKQETATAKDAEFLEKEKQPLKLYSGPSQFGSVSLNYPKTWSAYVNEKTVGATNLDGYFQPNFVHGLNSDASFALRLQVVDRAYEQELKLLEAQIKQGTVKASPFRAPSVPSTLGSRLDGEILPTKKGSLILIPLRDKTLRVWTESDERLGDFNNIVLANLSFSP